MKYLEELQSGDTFTISDKIYLLTSDFKGNGNRLCYSMEDGFPSWISQSTIVESINLFKLDKDNNILSIKNVPPTTKNIR